VTGVAKCAVAPLRTMSICAGIGRLEAGVAAVVPNVRVVVAVERQAFAAATLVARMEDEAVVEASLGRDPDAVRYPIWDDIFTFDGRPWTGAVDLIVAGYPCVGESVAGKRLGAEDERWLWAEVYRIVCQVRPAFLLVENVAAHLSGSFRRVLGCLSALGWHVEWDCIPAASVGAPHLRDRLFVLAANPDRFPVRVKSERDQREGWSEREAERGDAVTVHDGSEGTVANSDGIGCEVEREHDERVDDQEAHRDDAYGRDGEVPDSDGSRRKRGRPEAIREERQDATRCDRDRRESQTSSRVRRGHDGLPQGVDGRSWVDGVPPTFDRNLEPEFDADWADRIHALGNSVVKAAASQAWRVLYGRLFDRGGEVTP